MDLKKVKFMYLQDPGCPERVVTVARLLDGDVMRIAWCINKVSETWEREDGGTWERITHVVTAHDKFNKRIARRITTGRLRCDRAGNSIEVKLNPDSTYARQAIESVRDAASSAVVGVIDRHELFPPVVG